MRAELIRDLLTREAPKPSRAVRLAHARVVGALDLEFAALRCPLVLEECHFGEPVMLSEATALTIRFLHCTLPSLSADQLMTQGDLDLRGSSVAGTVRIRGAHIGGNLRVSGAKLINPGDRALDADDMRVEQNAFLRNHFEAVGGVYMARAHIGGRIVFDTAILTRREPDPDEHPALRADRLQVGQGMFCRDGFKAVGAVRLPRAEIGGQLSLKNATLHNPTGQALYAHGLRVDHSMRCEKLVASGRGKEGAVYLVGGQIGGQLNLEEATLRNKCGPALSGRGVRTELDLLCGNGFSAEGEVLLPGAEVRGDLSFDGSTLRSNSELVLDLQGVKASTLDLRFADMPAGTVNLEDATVGRLHDKPYPPLDRWPSCRLDGCRYETLDAVSGSDAKACVEGRLCWLAGDPTGYMPRPYEQLAAVYRAHGEDSSARRVAIAKQRRRRGEALDRPAKLWNWFLELTVGHGYRPWLAGVWLVGLIVIGGVLFGRVFDDPPSDDLTSAPDEDASFEPFIYAADALVPVLDLGQEAAFNAHHAAHWATVGFTVVGWLLTTALLAGFVVRRQ